MSLDTRARLARSNSIRAWAPQGRCIKSAIEGTAAFPRLMCRRAAEVILKASLHVECFSHAIEPAPRAGVCGRVRAHFFAACATPAAALFLGRSRILRSRRARPAALRNSDSAYHRLERPPTAGVGLDCSVVEVRGLRTISDTVGNAVGRGILAAGSVPAGEERGEHAGSGSFYGVHGRLPGFLRPEFAGTGRPGGRGAYILGIVRLSRRSHYRDGNLVLSGGTRQRDCYSHASGSCLLGIVAFRGKG